ncbi:MAG: hypothetical protein LBR06_00485, partial [Bacteroidales bacterium]|nr:hypothetical protein [Bacteroidales bacterium]
YNNLFIPANPDEKQHYGFPVYSRDSYPSWAAGNAYYGVAQPKADEKNTILKPDVNPSFKLEEKGNEVYVSFDLQGFNDFITSLITTETLGKAKFPKEAYEQPDGAPIMFNIDYHGNTRSQTPAPGPFERSKTGANSFRVW